MTKLIRTILLFLVSLLLYWGAAMLFGCLVAICWPLFKEVEALVCVAVFFVGCVIFKKWRFNAIYVFGHETTHWLVAKMFLKDTGKMKVGSAGGSVEISGTNVWITLAPYIVPFYVLLAVAILGISQIFVYPTPDYGKIAFGVAMCLTYSYHIMLTWFVLKQQQSDLEIYGRFFSFGLIAFGNVLLLLLALLMVTQQWEYGWNFLKRELLAQQEWIFFAITRIRRML